MTFASVWAEEGKFLLENEWTRICVYTHTHKHSRARYTTMVVLCLLRSILLVL